MLADLWHRDSGPLYDLIVETFHDTTLAGFPYIVAPADLDRRILMFASAGNGLNVITTDSAGAPAQGFQVNASSNPIVFTWDRHGPLCQAEWWITSTTTSGLTVWTASMRRPPVMYGLNGVFIDRAKTAVPGSSGRVARGASPGARTTGAAALSRILRERMPGWLGEE